MRRFDEGCFWFFQEENMELFLKVLDGCSISDSYWVFISGLTDVAVTITVTDTVAGETKVYSNALGQAFLPVLDTGAFSTCP